MSRGILTQNSACQDCMIIEYFRELNRKGYDHKGTYCFSKSSFKIPSKNIFKRWAKDTTGTVKFKDKQTNDSTQNKSKYHMVVL